MDRNFTSGINGHKSSVEKRATTTEMVYGEPIKLPGQLLQQNTLKDYEESYGDMFSLKKIIQDLKPQEVKRHGQATTFIFQDMKTASHAFIRRELLGGSLQPPYEGPYKIVKRSEKVITLCKNGKDINVSIDRLKAYILQENDMEKDLQKKTANRTTNAKTT